MKSVYAYKYFQSTMCLALGEISGGWLVRARYRCSHSEGGNVILSMPILSLHIDLYQFKNEAPL